MLRRLSVRIWIAAGIGVVLVCTTTAIAADVAPEGSEKLLFAVIGLCLAIVGFMGAVVKMLSVWLKKQQWRLQRSEPYTSANGERALDLIVDRMDTMEAHMRDNQKHNDMRFDQLARIAQDLADGQRKLAEMIAART